MGKQKWRCTLCDLLCSLLKRNAKRMPARFQLTVDVLLISELDDQVWGPRSEVCKEGTPLVLSGDKCICVTEKLVFLLGFCPQERR